MLEDQEFMKTIFAVFLLIPLTAGLKSYACNGPKNGYCTEHKILCDDKDKRIHNISGYYGFTYYYVPDHSCCLIDDYDPDDCLPGFNATVHSNLIDSCNGKKTCNFQTPIPDFKYCSIENDDDGRRNNFGSNISSCHTYDFYTYSYIQFECLPVTTALSTRSTIPTREHRAYTVRSTIKSTDLDSSKPEKSTETDGPEHVSGRTEYIILNIKAMALVLNKVTADTAVIVGSVVGCFLLVILFIIFVVIILKRKKDTCYKDGGISITVYETRNLVQ